MVTESPALAWFRSAKFGLFVHWGLYAIPAGFWNSQDCRSVAEWIMNVLHIPPAEYEKLADQFDPQEFDADLLVRRAKSWGPDCLPTLEAVGEYVSRNGEAIFGTEPVPVYPYELDWAEMTCRPHKLYLHILRPRSRIDLPRVEFRAAAARILADDLPLTVQNVETCEGEPNLRILLPQDWQTRRSYCVEVTIDTETPAFTPLEKGMGR